MCDGWREEELNSIDEILAKLLELRSRNKKWVFRGLSKNYDRPLLPSIDRLPNNVNDRRVKILLERQSIELFRAIYRPLAYKDEDEYLLQQDITTLMIMQHYGAPTRLLDWTLSPYIAAYFAVCQSDDEDGFIWGFEYDQYERMGSQQWIKFPEMRNGKEFLNLLTPAFQEDYIDRNWIVCQFLHKYRFNRINNQEGLFTFTSQFNIDHSEALKCLLDGDEFQIKYRIRKEDKYELRQILKNNFQIWHGMIYPDITGVAKGVKEVLYDKSLEKSFCQSIK